MPDQDEFRAEDWHSVSEVVCIVCPDCAFTFDAEHTDSDGGGFSCPACAELRLRTILGEILNEHHWVDAHPGEPCKRLLNAVRVSTWERWRAVLTGSEVTP